MARDKRMPKAKRIDTDVQELLDGHYENFVNNSVSSELGEIGTKSAFLNGVISAMTILNTIVNDDEVEYSEAMNFLDTSLADVSDDFDLALIYDPEDREEEDGDEEGDESDEEDEDEEEFEDVDEDDD